MSNTREFRTKKLTDLQDAFNKEAHSILHENVNSADKLIESYNALINYVKEDYAKRIPKTRKLITDTIHECRINLTKCAEKLKLHILLPTDQLKLLTIEDRPSTSKDNTTKPIEIPKQSTSNEEEIKFNKLIREYVILANKTKNDKIQRNYVIKSSKERELSNKQQVFFYSSTYFANFPQIRSMIIKEYKFNT